MGKKEDKDKALREGLKKTEEERKDGPACGWNGCTEKLHPVLGCPYHE